MSPKFVTDRLNRKTELSYNSYGQIKTITEAKSTPIEMTTELLYDPVTYQLTEMKRDGNTVATLTHDAIGRVETITDAAGLTLTYDPAGLLTKITNSRNIDINYPLYDGNHNLESIDYTDTTPDVTFTYDEYNRVITRTDGIGLYQYTYDANNRLINIDGPWIEERAGKNWTET